MGSETEAKLKCDRHEDLRRALHDAGAAFAGDYLQHDAYFDDEAGTLTAHQSALRLRQEKREDEVSGSSVVVTFKGPLDPSRFKKRPEVNLPVSERQAAEELLAVLGYRKVLVVEKRRSLWHFGGCDVALDELPLIGRFVEIEGPDEDAISSVQAALGLDELPHIPQSYTVLILREVARRGADATEVVFGG